MNKDPFKNINQEKIDKIFEDYKKWSISRII